MSVPLSSPESVHSPLLCIPLMLHIFCTAYQHFLSKPVLPHTPQSHAELYAVWGISMLSKTSCLRKNSSDLYVHGNLPAHSGSNPRVTGFSGSCHSDAESIGQAGNLVSCYISHVKHSHIIIVDDATQIETAGKLSRCGSSKETTPVSNFRSGPRHRQKLQRWSMNR